MTTTIHRPTIAKRPFSRLTDGEKHPVSIRRVLAKTEPEAPAKRVSSDYGHASLLASRCARGCDRMAPNVSDVDAQRICGRCAVEEHAKSAMQQLGVDESLTDLGLGHRWSEVEVSKCRFGCKVYENDLTGERVLAHNRTYGCRFGA